MPASKHVSRRKMEKTPAEVAEAPVWKRRKVPPTAPRESTLKQMRSCEGEACGERRPKRTLPAM